MSQTEALACLYCAHGVSVQLVAKGTLYKCPVCSTLWAVCPEIRAQLSRAAKKFFKK